MKTTTLGIHNPVVVAQASHDLDRAGGAWGRWQFPYLRHLSDGRLHVSFSVERDAASNYGKPMGHAYSGDEGKTWHLGQQQVEHEAEDGVLLPNGDRLQPVKGLPKRAEDYDLPDSVCDFVRTFGLPTSLYRAEELPLELSQWRFRRLPAGESEWVEEVADMSIPNQLRYVTQEGDNRGHVSKRKPGDNTTGKVRKGVLPTPFLRGKLRVAPDKSLWSAPCIWRMQEGRPMLLPVFVRSLDHGHTWDFLGEIHYAGDSDADPLADKRGGFTEPDFNFRPDGSVICLMRTSDGNGHGPLYLTRSTDGACAWSEPRVFDPSFDGGKMPQLLTLNNGVTLASYGQSGGPNYIALRATTDPAGLDWQPPVCSHFSPRMPGGYNSCGHTEMVALDDNRALMVYSDFNYPDAEGRPCKTILVRGIETMVTDER